MEQKEYNILFKKYLNNELSEKELTQFLEYTETNEDFFEKEFDEIDINSLKGELQKEALFNKITNHPEFVSGNQKEIKKIKFSTYLKFAASLLIFGALGLGGYLYLNQDKSSNSETANHNITKNNVYLSGRNSVTLQLPDGQELVVDKDSFSEEIIKDGIILSKDSNGAISFTITEKYVSAKKSGFHTFSTPKGESFSFILPDGSEVWLNSSTKLKIPANFNTKGRDVFLEGEAYFDVAHNTQKPFKIHSGNDVVKVLGTVFNIKAYSKEKYTYTTLLRGSVLVTSPENKTTLVPGEQSKTNNKTGNLTKKEVDVDQIVGWKNGYFKFTDQPIEDIFEELTRWYDIKSVDYKTNNKERFTASIKRTRSLAEVLERIEKVSKLRFKIEEGRIEVTE